MESVLFYFFALITVASAIGVVAARNPLHGALSLIGAFFGLAAEYVLLGAHLLAALQVLVYAGAVMVLFVFVIMLLNLREQDLGTPKITPMKILGGGALAIGGALLAVRVLAKVGPVAPQGGIVPIADLRGAPDFGTIEGVGRMIYGTYMLPFELTSLLLLVAIVAAVVVAKAKI